MILRFTVENWMSFRDRTEFSMIASRERQHGDRVARLPKYQARVLPIAAIYGGNASGKTNFFKALNFVKRFVVRGSQPDSRIAVEQFRLDPQCMNMPCRFSCELLIDESIYEYSFAVTTEKVVEERLVFITSSSETVLYDRRAESPNFDDSLKDDEFLQFAFLGTRDNQLFLTNAVSQKVDRFRPVYNWFRDNLVLVAPDARFGHIEQFLDEEHPLAESMKALLPQLDTGITEIDTEQIPVENLGLPGELMDELHEKVQDGVTARLFTEPDDESIFVNRIGKDLIARKLVTFHSMRSGEKARFEIRDESDGSRRLIDLLPAFHMLSASKSTRVFVFDEIGRSLHTILIRRLLEAYLASCSPESRTQLLMTTHDLLLMDQKLLRRDEMWVTERDETGATGLYSFSDFKDVRYDKDLRKSYLQGRLGGVPRVSIGDCAMIPASSHPKNGTDTQ